MSSRPLARLAAVLLPAVLLLPVAAHAEKVVTEDGVGDARAINLADAGLFGEGGDGPLFLDAPDETSVDITSTTITHAKKRLTVAVQFRDLAVTDGHSVDLRIFTPKGRYALYAALTPGGRAEADFYPEVVGMSSDDALSSAPKPCRTVRARYDLAADLVTVSVPTACLDTPKWVQVALGASRLSVTPIGDGSINLAGYADDGFRAGLSENSRGRSPKVRRG